MVTADFSATIRPQAYVVHMEPEGGSRTGTWSGSGNTDAKDPIAFADVPPGKYVLRGRPNPGSDQQETEPVTIDLAGGKTAEITLSAK